MLNLRIVLRDTLYPEIEPYRTGYLQLDDLHQMYWEESGNPEGVPVLVIHGGPGGGSSPMHRQFFDPEYYRIILYDQRGAGKSLPYGELKNNTTPYLIEDIETLRVHLGIQKWYIFGGSWGVTLGLAYGEAHPGPCLGFVLRGVFLCRASEFKWVLWDVKNVFPEEHKKLLERLSPKDRTDWQSILKGYYKLLTDPDPSVHYPAATTWSCYEGTLATLLPNPHVIHNFAQKEVSLGLARMEAAYFLNNIFLPLNSLLDNVGRIRHLPAVIVHGRYDMVCPIISAEDLLEKWPEAEFRLVLDAGHSSTEPGIQRELVMAMEAFKFKYKNQDFYKN